MNDEAKVKFIQALRRLAHEFADDTSAPPEIDREELGYMLRKAADALAKPDVKQFMGVCDSRSGTSYLVVTARDKDEAMQIIADDNPDRENIEIMDGTFEENLLEQYGGVAVLTCYEG